MLSKRGASFLLLCNPPKKHSNHPIPPNQTFVIERGPDRRISEYVASMQNNGFCVLTALLPTSLTDHLRAACHRVQDPAYDGDVSVTWNFTGLPVSGQPKGKVARASIHNLVSETPATTTASVNPVALAVIRKYLRCRAIKFGHSPQVSCLKPQDGSLGPGSGWHSDWPYRLESPPFLEPGEVDKLRQNSNFARILLSIQRSCYTSLPPKIGRT